MLQSGPKGFDEDAALKYLERKYGTTKTSHAMNDSADEAEKKKDAEHTRKAKRPLSPIHGGGNIDTSPEFTPKKYEIVTVEENRPIVEVLREMGAIHYKLGESQQGSKLKAERIMNLHLFNCPHSSCLAAYMNAVKNLRRCKHVIKTKEEAKQVPGIGKKLADHIDEFLKTGDVKHFEECRSRLA